jgi:hypothetical protein
MRQSEFTEATVLGKKPGKSASSAELILRILRIATDDSEQLNVREALGWRDMKLKEIARLARILRSKVKFPD